MQVRIAGRLAVLAVLAVSCGSASTGVTVPATTAALPDTSTSVLTKEAVDDAKPAVAATSQATPTEGTETSLDSPLPVGEVAQVGDWAVRVTSVSPDAAAVVLDENEFNEPAADGEVFFLVSLEATYTGSESSTFWFDNSLKVVGESGVAYESFDAYCGLIPDSFNEQGEAFSGGTVTGNECWRISASDANSLVLILEGSFAFDNERHFLSLDPVATPIDASTASAGSGIDTSAAIPVGGVAQVGDWSLRVASVAPNAEDIVLGENQFNETPDEGHVFVLVSLEATYTGSESSTFWADMSLKVVGDSAVAYEGYDGYCGSIPDSIDSAGETFPGGTVTGNNCWIVSESDAASLVLLAEESFAFDGSRTLFSLDADAVPLIESTEGGTNVPDFSDAVPFGQVAQVGDWSLRVLSVAPDAEDVVMGESDFNEATADGEVFYMVLMEATYTGSESSIFWIENTLKLVGDSAVAYEGFAAYCGLIPDSLDDQGEAFPGAIVTGNACWRVSADDVDSLVLIAEEFFSFDDETRVIFSLTP